MSAQQIDTDSAIWSGPAAGQPVIVLLHGYGSDEHDLWGAIPHLPREFTYVSVRAPGRAHYPLPGYAWFPISDLAARDPSPTTAATRALLTWMDAELAEASSIALLGFSQGGAIAIQAMRLAPTRFAAIVNLSGYATPGVLHGDTDLTQLKPDVFWGRGDSDRVIPQELIDYTHRWLPVHASVDRHLYPGLAHGVSHLELTDVSRFLLQAVNDPGLAVLPATAPDQSSG